MKQFGFDESEDQALQNLIDRNTDCEEVFNAVKVTQVFTATIQTDNYTDEDGAEDMADGLELESIMGELITNLRGYIEGRKFPKYTAQKLLKRLERFTCVNSTFDAKYISKDYEPDENGE